jgi:RNA polymerase sigma factor (sigma-70 family)
MNIFTNQISKLVKGCKANERPAQEGLYKLFYADLLKVCYRYFRSDDLATEALNTTFLKVFQNINSFDGQKGELEGWIRTILIRTCIDLVRKEAKFITTDHFEEATENVFILPEVLDKLYTEDILKAIRRLPAATQLVFNLYIIEGYTHQEIGDQLQISESTSRWHLSEARKLLRAILQPQQLKIKQPTEQQNKAK